MNEKFLKPYDPKNTEVRIYQLWIESGFFNPDNLPGQRKKTFTIVIPPPNITGSLHMGHALNNIIQDILIRKKRMEGFKALWVPGTDHAGIATQNVVEKELKKEGLSRHDLGREKFIEKVWEWKDKYGNIILDQLRKLGCSCDWSRNRFTMDEGYVKAVETAFKYYYEKGWIYQGDRVVNWCPRCQTSLSDLELEYDEAASKLWFIKYPFKDGSGYIAVATTRPETMLGDAAVAVNPKDERYKKLVGKTVILPIMKREIPIITDRLIETKFGTGAVKVTPGHDIADFEISERHKLPLYNIINKYGKMTSVAGKDYGNLKVLEAREKVVAELEKQGLIEKIEDYQVRLAKCYRCNSIIEPQLSKQWFVKMDKLAELAKKAIKKRKVIFHPKKWEKVCLSWLDNIKDWCISRQIWWGHKIPFWKCMGCNNFITNPEIKSQWFIVRHGETDWNIEKRWQGHTEIPLNEVGRKQAKEAVKLLKNKNIDLVISSDLIRCKETAEIIAKELGVELIFDKSLRERHGGIFEGLTTAELEEKHRAEIKDLWKYEGKPEKGESWQELEERVLTAFRDHISKHGHKNVVIVTHGGPIRVLVKTIKNIPFEEARQFHPQNTEVIELIINKDKCKNCGGDILESIDDVLDTWFSSALWPFATLGWPEKTKDLETFYPTQVISTARDIIYLWIVRMVFSGMEFMKEKPFSDVLIHPTVLNKEGKRMSKSLGTGVDPLGLVEKYGADATRFGLIYQMMGNQDIHFGEEPLLAGKKFINKLWNINRFVLTKTNDKIVNLSKPKAIKDKETKKILGKLDKIITQVDKDIENYKFGHALHLIYDFTWHDFADKYLEYSKDKQKKEIKQALAYTLTTILKLSHPFMPFVTEEIWDSIKKRHLLIIEEWPK